jgi:hypothetical protein
MPELQELQAQLDPTPRLLAPLKSPSKRKWTEDSKIKLSKMAMNVRFAWNSVLSQLKLHVDISCAWAAKRK